MPPKILNILIFTRIIDIFRLIEVNFTHNFRGLLLGLLLRSVLVLHKSLDQFFLGDDPISFQINPMETPDDRILVFVLHYKVDDKHQNAKLNVRDLQSTEFSHVCEQVEHALVVDRGERLLEVEVFVPGVFYYLGDCYAFLWGFF